jgi:hypothetical protein
MGNKVAKWKRWIEVVCHDGGNLMLSREMFLDIQGMISKNPSMQQSDYFHAYLKDTYLAHVLMMLRKHVKTDNNSISLAGLANDIINNPHEITPLDTTLIQTELSRFKLCAEKFEQFADRVIAHNDKRPPVHTPTYNQVHEAIDAMDRLSIQCSLAVGGDYTETCKPAVQGGWLLIFRDSGIEA